MSKVFRVIIAAAAVVAVLLSLSSCNKNKYPRPSREYYVSDFADALLPGSRNTFFYEGEALYKATKDDPLGGAQVVVATMEVSSEADAASINATDVYREWEIGEKDMGLLILLIFTQDGEELALVGTQIEIGYGMEPYITAMHADRLITECLYNPDWEGSLDMGLGEMYFEFLKTIYVDAYGYESYSYEMEDYREYLVSATDATEAAIPMSLLVYIFSPYGSLFSKIITIIGFVLLGGGGLLGGGLLFRRRGGGGSSGGYGIRR